MKIGTFILILACIFMLGCLIHLERKRRPEYDRIDQLKITPAYEHPEYSHIDMTLTDSTVLSFLNVRNPIESEHQVLNLFGIDGWFFSVINCKDSGIQYDINTRVESQTYSSSCSLSIGEDGLYLNSSALNAVNDIFDVANCIDSLKVVVSKIPTYPDFGIYSNFEGKRTYIQKYRWDVAEIRPVRRLEDIVSETDSIYFHCYCK